MSYVTLETYTLEILAKKALENLNKRYKEKLAQLDIDCAHVVKKREAREKHNANLRWWQFRKPEPYMDWDSVHYSMSKVSVEEWYEKARRLPNRILTACAFTTEINIDVKDLHELNIWAA